MQYTSKNVLVTIDSDAVFLCAGKWPAIKSRVWRNPAAGFMSAGDFAKVKRVGPERLERVKRLVARIFPKP